MVSYLVWCTLCGYLTCTTPSLSVPSYSHMNEVDFKSAELFSFSRFSIGPRFLNTGEFSLYPAIRIAVAGEMKGYPIRIRNRGCLTDDYDGIKYYCVTDTWFRFLLSVTNRVVKAPKSCGSMYYICTRTTNQGRAPLP